MIRLIIETKTRLVIYEIMGIWFSFSNRNRINNIIVAVKKVDTFRKSEYSFIFFSPLRLPKFKDIKTIGKTANEIILK